MVVVNFFRFEIFLGMLLLREWNVFKLYRGLKVGCILNIIDFVFFIDYFNFDKMIIFFGNYFFC